MGFFDSLGAWADRMSTSERNHNFYIIRTPLFKQFLDICVWNYPDPLDLYAWSYEIVPMYFFAGAIDYGIMIFLISLYSQFSLIWTARGSPNTARSLLIDLQSPRSNSFQILFLISFVLRAWSLGLRNIKRTCNFQSMQWLGMRKLTILVLLLCPALIWSWFLEITFGLLKLDRERPWLAQLFWLMLSRDWDIAQYYSGFFASKGEEVLQQESAARLNETWGGFLVRCVKITLIATPLEMFVKNLPYMIVALVFAVGRNGPAISAFSGTVVKKLRSFSLVERFLRVDEAISTKRDLVLLLFILHYRKGQLYCRRSEFPKYIVNLHMFADANIKPILLTFQRYVESGLLRFWGYTELVFQLSRVGSYFKISRREQSSKTLHGRRFRLLQLHPSAYPDGPIICVLSWHNLDSKPSYTAISYVWGSDERNSTIILNGKECQTTASAVTALKGLRSRWRRKNFWIDAICIDQTSDTDKAEQICIMADIYRNAKQVTVWLGPGEEGALALSLARRILIRSSLGDAMGSSRYSLDAPAPAWKALQKMLRNSWFQRSWVVQEVMSSKVVVQYGDAQLDWTILSQFAMAVESEAHVMAKLYQSIEDNDQNTYQDNTLKLRYIRIMEEFRAMHSGDDRQLSLLFYLIRMFRSSSRFKATNTQDRIYALLNLSGLATDANLNYLLNKSDLLGNKTPKNTANYHDRLSNLFTTTAKHLISSGPENRRLDILAHAGTCHTHGKTSLPNLPSWVPDWSLDDSSAIPFIGHDGTLELLQHPRLNGILEDVANLQSYDEISFSGRPKQEAARKKLKAMASEMLEKTMYRASKDTLPSFNLIEHPRFRRNILELSGVSIDRIHGIGNVFPLSDLSPAAFFNTAPQGHLKEVASTLTSWHLLAYTHLIGQVDDPAAGQAQQDTFERTLLGDLSHSTFDFTLPNVPTRPAPQEKLWNAAKLSSLALGVLKLDDLPGGKEKSVQALGEWMLHVGTVCGGRVFGITEKGRMGLFPLGCGDGDEVCVFDGTGVPFVLRRVKRGQGGGRTENRSTEEAEEDEHEEVKRDGRRLLYELVGPAYVHGVMDGEAMEGEPKRTSFMLK